MKITIQSVYCSIRKPLYQNIERKVQKLKRLFSSAISVDIRLINITRATPDNKMCYMRLVIPGNDLIANRLSFSFEEAIAQVVAALERQIEKKKTKMKRQLSAVPALVLGNNIN